MRRSERVEATDYEVVRQVCLCCGDSAPLFLLSTLGFEVVYRGALAKVTALQRPGWKLKEPHHLIAFPIYRPDRIGD